MLVVTKHKWESFIQQRGDIYPNLVREFYAHLVTKGSFLMICGVCVRFDEGYINSMFGLSCVEDEHEERMELMYSFIMRRQINMDRIIIDETFECTENDKALAVKRTLITTATWRQLNGVESKDKGKRKVK
ncbi:hypothetical protein V6N11_034760 [Hibiscus sabdariffa]|uniref:Uncharacterized protein n=2 Tax=Hibiscus sabdariffa TaxID=183260 RepID=A0ABR2AL20_9ROSI